MCNSPVAGTGLNPRPAVVCPGPQGAKQQARHMVSPSEGNEARREERRKSHTFVVPSKPGNLYRRDPAETIDNNGAEREMKQIAIGCKNWLFFGSPQGGKTAATLYTFTSTCRRLGVEPWAYYG
jgi:hypothetical protein